MSEFDRGPGSLPQVVIDSSLNAGPISLGKWRVWVGVYGPMCSAWLVKRMGSALKRGGAFKVFVPRGIDASIQGKRFRWFKLCVAHLRRCRRWQVVERRKTNGVEYEFRWLLSRHSGTVLS